MLWIRGHVAPSLPLYVHGGLDPFADYFLPRYSLQKDVSARELPHTFSPLAGYYAMEGGSNAPQAVVFTREHGRLWNIARQRYFEVSVLPLSQSVYFGGGWYEAESSGRSSWRWMARRSRMLLAPIRGKARLHLRLREPDGLIPLAPRIALFFNGTPLAEIRSANGLISGTWSVLARDSEPNELIIEVDRVFNARRQRQGQDDRDLGLKLDEMSWSAEIPSQR
jgi:hypothetical protein